MPMASVMTWTTAGCVRRVDICNGPGAIYECGCSDIQKETAVRRQPARRLGRVWRWHAADADADGICDDVDDCVGEPTSAFAMEGVKQMGTTMACAIPRKSWCGNPVA